MEHFEITLFNYVRERVNIGDFSDKLGILAMKNVDVIVTAKHDFDNANEADINEEDFYDEDFLLSYWIELFTLKD